MELIAVTHDRMEVDALARVMIEVEPFVDYFIIRERTKKAVDYIRLIDLLTEANINIAKLIVNDRVDVAVAAGLQKVQLPGHGLTVQQVKLNFPKLRAGKSVHSLKEAMEARVAGADWLLYGHVFSTDCKKGLPARGIVELKKIAENVPSDLYVIGGIKPWHVAELGDVKIKGIAVMSSIFDSPEPASAAEEYYKACRSYQTVERN